MNDVVLNISYAGPLVTYQDAGRFGKMRFGVPASGPMDRLSHAAANAALGNSQDSTAIEISVGGLAIECISGSLSLSVAGGNFGVDRGGEKTEGWSVFSLHEGEKMTIRAGKGGSWAYLAFAGCVEAREWLGQTATHSASGLGGGQLTAGRDIRISNAQIREDRHGSIAPPGFLATDPMIRVVRGHQDRYFDKGSLDTFLSENYQLTASFDRMGVRLSGSKLNLAQALSIPSEPITRGAVQVAGDGVPTVLLSDHQTTGGYPKIATVISDDVDKISQMRANDPVRFIAISPKDAVQIMREAAQKRASYLVDIANPKGTLEQRLMKENLISVATFADTGL